MSPVSRDAVPAIVASATALARQLDFSRSCTAQVGRLLQVLAATVPRGTIGELGTGAGVGTAWLASGLGAGTSLVTVERDAARASAARGLFHAAPRVTVLVGDWRELLASGPFGLLFVDVGEAKHDGTELVIQALARGGIAVLDDLTPEECWPTAWRGRGDPVRDSWLNDPRLAATEVRVSPREAVILATRLA